MKKALVLLLIVFSFQSVNCMRKNQDGRRVGNSLPVIRKEEAIEVRKRHFSIAVDSIGLLSKKDLIELIFKKQLVVEKLRKKLDSVEKEEDFIEAKGWSDTIKKGFKLFAHLLKKTKKAKLSFDYFDRLEKKELIFILKQIDAEIEKLEDAIEEVKRRFDELVEENKEKQDSGFTYVDYLNNYCRSLMMR